MIPSGSDVPTEAAKDCDEERWDAPDLGQLDDAVHRQSGAGTDRDECESQSADNAGTASDVFDEVELGIGPCAAVDQSGSGDPCCDQNRCIDSTEMIVH